MIDCTSPVFDTNKCTVKNESIHCQNSEFISIMFTYRLEQNKLLFFDVLVLRADINNLECDIFRKDSSTFRHLPNNCFHCLKHKMTGKSLVDSVYQ